MSFRPFSCLLILSLSFSILLLIFFLNGRELLTATRYSYLDWNVVVVVVDSRKKTTKSSNNNSHTQLFLATICGRENERFWQVALPASLEIPPPACVCDSSITMATSIIISSSCIQKKKKRAAQNDYQNDYFDPSILKRSSSKRKISSTRWNVQKYWRTQVRTMSTE
jgi:hypothetical protein